MTATIRMQAVAPIANPRMRMRPRMVPMAIARNRKISGALETAWFTQFMRLPNLDVPDGLVTQVAQACGVGFRRAGGVCVRRATVRQTRRAVRRTSGKHNAPSGDVQDGAQAPASILLMLDRASLLAGAIGEQIDRNGLVNRLAVGALIRWRLSVFRSGVVTKQRLGEPLPVPTGEGHCGCQPSRTSHSSPLCPPNDAIKGGCNSPRPSALHFQSHRWTGFYTAGSGAYTQRSPAEPEEPPRTPFRRSLNAY